MILAFPEAATNLYDIAMDVTIVTINSELYKYEGCSERNVACAIRLATTSELGW